MIEVVVAFRDAVMATLMAWSGVEGGEAVLTDGGSSKGPAAKPAPVEKVVDHKKPAAYLIEPECPKAKATQATHI